MCPYSAFARERLTWVSSSAVASPGIVTCFDRSSVSSPAGASFVIVEPAPIVAPAPTSTGATSMTPEPMNALSPMTVRCLLAPS